MSSKKRLEKAVRKATKANVPQDIETSDLAQYIKLLYEMKQEILMAKRLEEEDNAS